MLTVEALRELYEMDKILRKYVYTSKTGVNFTFEDVCYKT